MNKNYGSILMLTLSTLVILLLLAACLPTEPGTLTVMTHDSFAISEEVLQVFEEENKINVQFLKAGDTGTALNKAILAKDAPLADIFYGVDNTFLSRALSEGIFTPYEAPILRDIPERFKLDPQNRALPVDFGDVCLNYDLGYFTDGSIPPPESLEDLLDPLYRDMLVVENPATSSPGLAFLLATIGHFGDPGYLDYWQDLVNNGVLVVNDWDSAYYTEFSLHGGDRPIVVSYASSPPAEVIFAETPIDQAPSTAVTANSSCFRQIEFVGILTGTKNREMAERFIDFMLSPTFQSDMPLQMFVYPVNPEATLPPEFLAYTSIPDVTSEVKPDVIAANRERWLQVWTNTVLH